MLSVSHSDEVEVEVEEDVLSSSHGTRSSNEPDDSAVLLSVVEVVVDVVVDVEAAVLRFVVAFSDTL